MDPMDILAKSRLNQLLEGIGEALDADAVAIIGPIAPGLDAVLLEAMKAVDQKRDSVAVILNTLGGVTEAVEPMVNVLRHEYDEVTMIIPDKAMSAGTIFALSADRIMMGLLSCLGPIDPQVKRRAEDEWVPGLAYLVQYERFIEKSVNNQLTSAEFALLRDLDLATLYRIERARELSIDLVKKWLVNYKFKKWERNGKPVSNPEKERRAGEIAKMLNDTEKWHSHARPINREVLRTEVGLQIDELETEDILFKYVMEYFELLVSYMNKNKLHFFVQSKEYSP